MCTHACLYDKKMSRKGPWEMSIHVLGSCGWLCADRHLQLDCTFFQHSLGLASRWSCYICNGDEDSKSIFLPQTLFLIWIDVWVILVKKNGRQFSSHSPKAGVINVSRRWMGLQDWLLFHQKSSPVGSGKCIPFTYSRYPAGLWQWAHSSCQKQCCSSCDSL